MKNRNGLIRLFREICGEKTPDGFFLNINDNLKVPNFVDKEEPVEYPEIRITPFLSDNIKLKVEQKISENEKLERKVYEGVFQVDIFSKSTPELNIIYQALYDRINDFINPEIITYNYDEEYTIETPDYYYNTNYTKNNSILSQIIVDKEPLIRVHNFDEMHNESWFLDEDMLYIKTEKNIETLQIKYIINGLVFPDGESTVSKCLYNNKISEYQYLSQYELNEVKRVTFDISLNYEIHRKYKLGPVITEVNFKE